MNKELLLLYTQIYTDIKAGRGLENLEYGPRHSRPASRPAARFRVRSVLSRVNVRRGGSSRADLRWKKEQFCSCAL